MGGGCGMKDLNLWVESSSAVSQQFSILGTLSWELRGMQWCIFIDNIQKEVGVEYQEWNESDRGVEEKRVVVEVKGREAEACDEG